MTKTTDHTPMAASRRRFLRESAVAGGAVLAGGLVRDARAEGSENLPPNVPKWMQTPGEEMGSQLYGTPAPFEKGVVKNIPKNLKQYISASGRTPLQELDGYKKRASVVDCLNQRYYGVASDDANSFFIKLKTVGGFTFFSGRYQRIWAGCRL